MGLVPRTEIDKIIEKIRSSEYRENERSASCQIVTAFSLLIFG